MGVKWFDPMAVAGSLIGDVILLKYSITYLCDKNYFSILWGHNKKFDIRTVLVKVTIKG